MTSRRWLSVVLLVLLLVFALQNLHVIRVSVLFWQLRASASLVIFVSFAAGVVAGLLQRSRQAGRG
jgi:uncharacterized integral membrane protein